MVPRSYRRVAQPVGQRRLLKNNSMAETSSRVRHPGDDVEAAYAPRYSPKERREKPTNRFTVATILVEAVAILGLLAALARARALCGATTADVNRG